MEKSPIFVGMSAQKKIYAIISYPFLPATTGGEISTLQILHFMGLQHQVKVFTVDPYQPVEKSQFSFELDFGMRFKPLRYLNPLLVLHLIREIRAFGADAVFFDQPFMGWMIPWIRQATGLPVFLRSNNIEYLRFRSMHKWWWPGMRSYEAQVYRAASLVVFVSDVDQEKAITEFGLEPENTLLTPYGIPQQQLPEPIADAKAMIKSRHGIANEKAILLFFATLNYAPNTEAVSFIVNEITPRLHMQMPNGYEILICGKHLPEALQQQIKATANIQYLGFVPDIETYIDGSDVMINPILSGGGVKTKAIDTLGRGQVVISTRCGAEGIDPTVCGNNLRVVPDHDWDAFVSAVVTFLQKPERNLPETFFSQYSWSGIIARLSAKLFL